MAFRKSCTYASCGCHAKTAEKADGCSKITNEKTENVDETTGKVNVSTKSVNKKPKELDKKPNSLND